MSCFGIVLSGGGARGAYQAGVIDGLCEIFGNTRFPLRVITGVSAGAINAGGLAAQAHSPVLGAKKIAQIWKSLRPEAVIQTDFGHFVKNLSKIAFNLGFRRFNAASQKPPYSLLDFSPLRTLLTSRVDFDQIGKNLRADITEAVSMTATDYANSNSITFIETMRDFTPWERKRRFAVRTALNCNHILASSALPLFFSPVEIEGRYFGDGSLRNNAPLSPAIHLGADKLFIVSVKKPVPITDLPHDQVPPPTPAKIFSLILNALLLDQTEFDVERLSRINQTLKRMTPEAREKSDLRVTEFMWLQPSQDLGEIAKRHLQDLPRPVRWMLWPFGSLEHSAEIASYLLFDRKYCTELVQLGYSDTVSRKDEIIRFMAQP